MFLYVAVVNFFAAFVNSDIVHSNKSSDDYVPCERGWYYYRDNCYRAEGGEGKKLSWPDALARCRGYGADLVSIHSQEEQDFIIAFLILENQYVSWTGLNDRENESVYTWSDGSDVNYTNWYSSEPTGLKDESEDCVYMYIHPIGTWNDVNCDYTINDYICEMKPNPRERSPNLKYCSTEHGGGLEFKTSCYHLVTQMQTWSNAEMYCKSNYNGHLLTIRDKLQDLFLEYAFRDIKTETWIGIKIRKHLQQKWTSGWYVRTEKFNNEKKFEEGTCVARNNTKDWITIPCSRELPFICEVTKETPPVLKSPPNGSHCPKEFDDWQDIGGDYCYYIQTNTKVNFSEARSQCKGRGGDLISIHSQEETDILHPFIKNTGECIYIGLNRVKGITGKLFGWTDGSVLDYKNWDTKEPNREEEECVEVLTLTMKWRDTLCGNELSGYICSAKKILPSSEVDPVTDDSSRHASHKALIGVSVSIHLLVILLNVVM